MFRDSFNSYGILSTFIHAAGMAIWGWRICALLNITLVFVVALGLGVYYLWSRVMPPWAAFLAALMYFVYNYRIHLPWPNYYATFFVLCVGMLLMVWVQSDHRYLWLAAAGLTSSLVFLARQTLAPPLILLVALFVFCAPAATRPARFDHRLMRLAIFLGGFLIAILPFFAYLYVTAALDDWWVQSVRLIPAWYTPFAQIRADALSQVVAAAASLVSELPFLTVVAAAASVAICVFLALGRISHREEALALLAVISLTMLSQVYPNEGLWRRVLALSLGFGWLVYLLNRVLTLPQFGRISRFPAVFVFVALVPILAPKLAAIYEEASTAFSYERHRELYFQYMNEPEAFKGMWLPTAQASFYSAIYQEIVVFRRTHPGAPVIVTNGDVLPLTFVRHNEGFSPMFTVYPSLAWSRIARNPVAHSDPLQMASELARGRQTHEFESDTANVLAYSGYWTEYASFVRFRQPLIVNSGQPVPRYARVMTVTFNGSPAVVDSQYYFWWSQFSDKPQSVIWKPES